AGHGLPEAAAVRACFGATPADTHAAPHAASIIGAIVERPAALVIATYFEARPRAFEGRFDDGGADLPEEPRHARAGGHQLRATCGYHSSEARLVEHGREQRSRLRIHVVSGVSLKQRSQCLAHVDEPLSLRVGEPGDADAVAAQPH